MEDQTKLNGLSVKFLFFIVRKMIYCNFAPLKKFGHIKKLYVQG
jgi:hypothetical protein